MTRWLLFLLFAASPAFAVKSVKDIVGEWVYQHVTGTVKIIIHEDGSFEDGKVGSGDIQHINARRFKITIYKDGSSPVRCEVEINKARPNAGGFVAIRQLIGTQHGSDCDWDKLSPARGPFDKFQPPIPGAGEAVK